MKTIYLVQRMERKSFRRCAHNRIKIKDLDCYGQVETMWYESKMNAIHYCRKQNRKREFLIYFVRRISDYSI